MFYLEAKDKYTIVNIELDRPISPDVLKEINPPEVPLHKGVILSGRGPIWLYGALVHHYHPTPWVAVYDPRLNGGVVVASHTPGVNVGDKIEVK